MTNTRAPVRFPKMDVAIKPLVTRWLSIWTSLDDILTRITVPRKIYSTVEILSRVWA
jgi:hypothetical protein